MKLNSFLQCSFCKRPTFYNNHNVSAFISRGVSISIGKAANLPRQPTSKKICFEQEILLTHNLMDPQIIDPIHSALLSLCSTFRSNIVKLKTSLFLEP